MGNYDVIIVGGGHNGLAAAAYLARARHRVLVLERRDTVGGAAVSEHPFGPDFTVSSLSFAVSQLPARMARDLALSEHGYHVYPQGPYFAPRRDGGHLYLADNPRQRRAEIAKFAPADADAYQRWEEWLARLARVVAPLLDEIPPKLGAKHPMDLAGQAALLARLRRVDVRAAFDLTKLFTDSLADLLEERFVSDAMRGVLSVSAMTGCWAGPRSPGTAHMMLDCHAGESSWGYPRGGLGGLSEALAGAARAFGAEIRTSAPVARIDTSNGAVVGVTLDDGQEIRAKTVITTVHPKISFLRLVDRSALPADFVADIEAWRTRSGTVKINFAVDKLPRFTSYPEPEPQVYGGAIVLAESLDEVEGAFQEAAAGHPATLPFAEICIPSVFDPTLAPEGKHVVSAFTQWVPHQYAAKPHAAELEAYADRVVARLEAVAPGFTDSIIGRQVLGPYQMENEYGLVGGNIFHGELTLGQMFHCRPAAGYADLRTPIRGLYQAGSATPGGGGVTGIPGRNVVRQVLRDKRRQRWPGRHPAPTTGVSKA